MTEKGESGKIRVDAFDARGELIHPFLEDGNFINGTSVIDGLPSPEPSHSSKETFKLLKKEAGLIFSQIKKEISEMPEDERRKIKIDELRKRFDSISVDGLDSKDRSDLENYIGIKKNVQLEKLFLSSKKRNGSVETARSKKKKDSADATIDARISLPVNIEKPSQDDVWETFNFIFQDGPIFNSLEMSEKKLIRKSNSYGITGKLEELFIKHVAEDTSGKISRDNFKTFLRDFCLDRKNLKKINTKTKDKEAIFDAIIKSVKIFNPSDSYDKKTAMTDEGSVLMKSSGSQEENPEKQTADETNIVPEHFDGFLGAEKKISFNDDNVEDEGVVEEDKEDSLDLLEWDYENLDESIRILSVSNPDLAEKLKKTRNKIKDRIDYLEKIKNSENGNIPAVENAPEEKIGDGKNSFSEADSSEIVPLVKPVKEPRDLSSKKEIASVVLKEPRIAFSRTEEMEKILEISENELKIARREYVFKEREKKTSLGKVFKFFGIREDGKLQNDRDVIYYRNIYEQKIQQKKQAIINDLRERKFSEKELEREIEARVRFFLLQEDMFLWEERNTIRAEESGTEILDNLKVSGLIKKAFGLVKGVGVAGAFFMVLTADADFSKNSQESDDSSGNIKKSGLVSEGAEQRNFSEESDIENKERADEIVVGKWSSFEGALKDHYKKYQIEFEKNNPEFSSLEAGQIAHLKAMKFASENRERFPNGVPDLIHPGAKIRINSENMDVIAIENDPRLGYLSEKNNFVTNIGPEKSPEPFSLGQEVTPESSLKTKKEDIIVKDIKRLAGLEERDKFEKTSDRIDEIKISKQVEERSAEMDFPEPNEHTLKRIENIEKSIDEKWHEMASHIINDSMKKKEAVVFVGDFVQDICEGDTFTFRLIKSMKVSEIIDEKFDGLSQNSKEIMIEFCRIFPPLEGEEFLSWTKRLVDIAVQENYEKNN